MKPFEFVPVMQLTPALPKVTMFPEMKYSSFVWALAKDTSFYLNRGWVIIFRYIPTLDGVLKSTVIIWKVFSALF